jgi:FkbM family methyltransferase
MIRSSAKRVVDSWIPNLGHTYRQFREYRASLAPAAQTPFGFKFAGNSSMVSGDFERGEIDLFVHHLQRASICIDIGANIGLYSCLAASYGKHVVAIEPLAANLNLLYRNLVSNDFLDVEVFPVGLSSKSGMKLLFGSGTGASFVQGWAGVSDRFYSVVPVTTLDVIINTRFDNQELLIKMDVEGFENEVLKGAEHILSLNPKPCWLVEICLNDNFPQGLNDRFYETFEVFWRHGYQANIANGDQRSVQPDDVARWVKQGRVDFGSHNYLFS